MVVSRLETVFTIIRRVNLFCIIWLFHEYASSCFCSSSNPPPPSPIPSPILCTGNRPTSTTSARRSFNLVGCDFYFELHIFEKCRASIGLAKFIANRAWAYTRWTYRLFATWTAHRVPCTCQSNLQCLLRAV